MVPDRRSTPPKGAVDNLTFYLALVAVVRFTVIVLLWWTERIVVTDKRMMLSSGIITHRLGMMPLSKVTDLTFERTVAGRMLGYGTVIVESAGQNQAFEKIKYVPRPEEVYEAISERIFATGRTRATGELLRRRLSLPRWRRYPPARADRGHRVSLRRDQRRTHRPATPLHGLGRHDSPAELVSAAHAAGVDVLAITDHDTTARGTRPRRRCRTGCGCCAAPSSPA